MNRTRSKWSIEYKCCNDRNTSMLYFTITASFFTILFIAFYVVVPLTVKRNEAYQFISNDHGTTTTNENNEQVSFTTPSINSGPSSSMPIKPGKKGKYLDEDSDNSDDSMMVAQPVDQKLSEKNVISNKSKSEEKYHNENDSNLRKKEDKIASNNLIEI